MSTIIVTGLPERCKLSKVVYVFKSLLKSEGGVSNFWIKEMADIRGTDFKLAKIEFNVPSDGYRAMKMLNGFIFKTENFEYPLKAQIVEDDRPRPRRRSPSPYSHRAHGREYSERFEYQRYYDLFDPYPRDRSRSPIHHESSRLDMEIELLRKQRMIIEEERRILLEKKKLELIKEFGPSAFKEFKALEVERDRHYRPERLPDYRRRRPSPHTRRPLPFWPRRQKNRNTPLFNLPCKILLEEMKDIMEKTGTRRESFLLNKLVKSSLRSRLALVLEEKPILPGAKIVALYREKYPQVDDEYFVKKKLNELRESQPDEGTNIDKERTHAEDNNKQTNNKGSDDPKDSDTNEPDAAQLNPAVNDENSNLGWIKQELDDSDVIDGMQEDSDKKNDAESLDSSEVALALHDKNDQDWAEGEHGWADDNVHNRVPKT